MRYCVVQLPDPPARVGRLLRVPRCFLGSSDDARERIPRWLEMLGLSDVPIEQRELISPDQSVILRTGTLHADRRLVWRKP